MKSHLIRWINAVLGGLGLRLVRSDSTEDLEGTFHSWHYLRHNARRLEHLASLLVPTSGKSVLEIGAGIGDHSSYYLDRGCTVTITDSRPENVAYVKKRYPDCEAYVLDLEQSDFARRIDRKYDVVHCYGLLYHLSDPAHAIKEVAPYCKELMLIETAVSLGAEESNYQKKEDKTNPSQAMSGMGSRPTRAWLLSEMKKHFEHVYLPKTQPNHEEFPDDWSAAEKSGREARAVFICSNAPLDNPLLTEELPDRQEKQL